jgi:uncharacterized membrane protein
MNLLNKTTNTTATVDTKTEPKDNKKLFGILSYLGPLVIISLLVEKNDPTVKFHIKQGLVLLSIEIILSVIFRGMMWSTTLSPVYDIIHLALLVLVVIGIINVVQGTQKELPIVGGFARYFAI